MRNDQNSYIKKIKLELAIMMGRGHKFKQNFMLAEITNCEFFALQEIRSCMDKSPDQKGIYVSDLAKSLHIALSAASRMLKTLEERGLVYREIDLTNRRNICVSLTDEGEQLRKSCFTKIDKIIERVIISMGEEDAEKLIELWKKLSKLMESEFALLMEETDQKKDVLE